MQIDPSYYLNDSPTDVQGEVAGFDIRRSFVSNSLYSVFAVDNMNQVLYPLVVDVNFECAVNYKKAYDIEYKFEVA